MNSEAISSPGRIPATNSLPIDTSAATPYTIMMIEGGIRFLPAPGIDAQRMHSNQRGKDDLSISTTAEGRDLGVRRAR